MKKIFYMILLICFVAVLSGCKKEAGVTTEQIIVEDYTSMAEGTMTFEQIQRAAEGTPIVADVSIKEKVQWEKSKGIVIVKDQEGTYRVENLKCSEEDYNLLTIGSRIRVFGFKGASAEMILISDSSFDILD